MYVQVIVSSSSHVENRAMGGYKSCLQLVIGGFLSILVPFFSFLFLRCASSVGFGK